jgi:hypothetical protein
LSKIGQKVAPRDEMSVCKTISMQKSINEKCVRGIFKISIGGLEEHPASRIVMRIYRRSLALNQPQLEHDSPLSTAKMIYYATYSIDTPSY